MNTEYKILNAIRENLVKRRGDLQEKDRYYVGAVALDSKGNILSFRTNDYAKTHPKMARFSKKAQIPHKIYLHAEVAAIVATRYPIEALIVARTLKDGSFAYARPCPICQLAIREAKIKRVYYTDSRGNLVLFKEEKE
jgi:tRNA(Arg) A34 adenosine deaminase TadA